MTKDSAANERQWAAMIGQRTPHRDSVAAHNCDQGTSCPRCAWARHERMYQSSMSAESPISSHSSGSGTPVTVGASTGFVLGRASDIRHKIGPQQVNASVDIAAIEQLKRPAHQFHRWRRLISVSTHDSLPPIRSRTCTASFGYRTV
jgi:hypothetical protein